ncbi:zinc finger protein 345-like [Thrips palmi]|uniref:Zinc finger protein 345-like n=1 Tax=Thrips palmi TaxID=161013 RepID=A0A6P8YEW5_THRPL|nr:zinc finger protein 345-like [Thrips palmi]
MAQSCSVLGCPTKTKGVDPGHLKFYRYPRDASLLEKWKMALKNNGAKARDRICNLHFTDSDFKLTNLGWKVLIPSAVPTLNLPAEGVNQEPHEALIPIKMEAEECSSTCADQQEADECSGDIPSTVEATKESCKYELYSSTDEESNSSHDSESPERSDIANLKYSDRPSIGKAQNIRRSNIVNTGYRKLSRSKTKFLCCQSCNKQFDTRLLLLLHMSVHYEQPSFPCLQCKEKFVSQSKLKKHVCKWTPRQKHREGNLGETVEELPFYCDQCGLTFNCRSYLDHHIEAAKHLDSHCGSCAAVFSCKASLRRHVKSHHLGDYFVCSDCDRVFGTIEKWVSHIGLHGRLYECPECCKQHKGFLGLVAHLKCHNELIFYACNFCALLFSSIKAAEAHNQMKKHRGALADCYFCKRGFPPGCTHQYYHDHQLFTGESTPCGQEETKNMCIERNSQHWSEPKIKIREAEDCNMEKSALIQSQSDNQMNCVYSSVAIKEEIPEDDIKNNVILENVAIKCEDCNEVLASDSEMKLHQDQHKSRGDFSCIECGKQCHSNAALTEHYRDHVKNEADDISSSGESE